MSYVWGTASFAAPTFDGQLQIDDLNTLWQWNATSQVWTKRADLTVNETRSATLFARGKSIAINPMEFKQKLLRDHWDVAFTKSFVQVEEFDGTVLYGRIAHVTLAELLAWLPTVVPVSGGDFDIAFSLRVFEALDPSLKPDRVYGWNNLYGSMRGRNAYRWKRGRGVIGLPASAGIDPKFYSWQLITPLSQQMVNHFFGSLPGTAEDRAIWFPIGKRDLYRMRSNVGSTSIPTDPGRWCWNTATGGWQAAPPGTNWTTANGTTNPNPALLFLDNSAPFAQVDIISKAMKGCRFFANQVVGVVFYLMRCNESPNLYSFFCKPLGASQVAAEWSLNTVDWDLLAMTHHRGDASNSRFVGGFSVEQRLTSWRWMLHTAMPSMLREGGAELWSPDTDRVPESVSFYARNKATGLRTPLFPGNYRVVRRQNNTTMAFNERRG